MRFLMKLEMPTETENPIVADPGFNDEMRTILEKINAVSASFGVTDGRRVDSVILNVKDELELPAIAEVFHKWLNVKAEFLPELTPEEAEKLRPRVEAIIKRGQSENSRPPGKTDLDSLLRGEVDGADFHHIDHVRAGFEILRRHDFLTASQIFSDGLKSMAARAGNPGMHHVTITIAFLALIAERMHPDEDFNAFIAANPDLLSQGVLLHWYSGDRLGSALARRTFILPNAKR